MKPSHFCLLLTLCCTGLSSCKKDAVFEELAYDSNTGTAIKLSSISISEAKDWYFSRIKSLHSRAKVSGRSQINNYTSASNVIPIWGEAKQDLLYGLYDIVLVPFFQPEHFVFNQHQGAKLVFLKDSLNQVYQTIIVYEADEAYFNVGNGLDVQTFTGLTYQVDDNGYIDNILKIENGQIVDCGCLEGTNISTRDGSNPCYDFNSKNFWETISNFFGNFWGGIKDIITWAGGIFGGNGGNGDNGWHLPGIIVTGGGHGGGGGQGDGGYGGGGQGDGGYGGGFSEQIGNSLFEKVDIPTCRDDVSDLGDQFPAFLLAQEFGHHWLNAFTHAYLLYKNDPTVQSFSEGILRVRQQPGLAQDKTHFTGNRPNSAEAQNLYPALIVVYNALLDDYDNAGGQNTTRQCEDFSYSLGDLAGDIETFLLEEITAFIERYELNITPQEFHTFLGNTCLEAADYEDCLWTGYLNYDIGKKVAENPSYLNEIIRTPNQGNPIIDKNHPICPAMFQQFTVMDPVNCPDRQSIGISNLHIGLNVNGENQYYTLANLHIEVGIRPDCPINAAEGVANAINQAVLSAEIAIENNEILGLTNLLTNLPYTMEERLKGTILREINRQLIIQFRDCISNPYARKCDLAVAWPAEAKLVNDNKKAQNSNHYRTNYIDFENEFENSCN